ncbi:oxygen-independent coproporphyrinogen III oxidase [Novosphingobium sp.]|uniref:oxygen-independent coproporphyrinogen III oxidase n=1 Tax=Novosphingobium sp. TaxID=1874826 RepID=UPI0025D1BFB8|nr:oxygen-independent coproporphyrinogen III oxidase [Novosphingobium sp.]
MWTYHPDLLAVPVPRYTSYPTAAEFTSDIGNADLDHALRKLSGDVSIYLHIPFCTSICWYCGCNTSAANRRQRLDHYLDALHREIAQVGARLRPGVRVTRVAFGGGSPNALAPTDLVRLADALTLHLPLDNPVWSVEIDPRELTRDFAQVLGSIGFSHASLGVQTLAPHLQAAIGRVQPEPVIAHATDLLRANGVRSLNFDLMYGLPGQTWDDLEATLTRSIELGADRVALFGYAHVPQMIPRQRRIDASRLPDVKDRFAMAARGHLLLTRAGYHAIGFDHFARPGDPLAMAAQQGRLHRNFQGFTDDPAPVLVGLGASAISAFPHVIVQNEKNAGKYRAMVSGYGLSGALGVARSVDDQRRGAVIQTLLCQGRAAIDTDLAAQVTDRLAPFVSRGLATLIDGVLRIADDALPYARAIAALFDANRVGSTRRFSSAV